MVVVDDGLVVAVVDVVVVVDSRVVDVVLVAIVDVVAAIVEVVGGTTSIAFDGADSFVPATAVSTKRVGPASVKATGAWMPFPHTIGGASGIVPARKAGPGGEIAAA